MIDEQATAAAFYSVCGVTNSRGPAGEAVSGAYVEAACSAMVPTVANIEARIAAFELVSSRCGVTVDKLERWYFANSAALAKAAS